MNQSSATLARRKKQANVRICQNKQAKQENPEKLKAFFNRHPNAVRAISLLLLDKLEELFKDAQSPLSAEDREVLLSAVTGVRLAVRDTESGRDRMLRFLVAEMSTLAGLPYILITLRVR